MKIPTRVGEKVEDSVHVSVDGVVGSLTDVDLFDYVQGFRDI